MVGAVVAIFTVRALRAFEYNRQQALADARQRVQEEIAQRDALRQEYLQRIVEAQEEERTRIARELHDEFGQMLTGLAIGLRGAQISTDEPELLQQQLSQLEEMAVQALDNMRHMVNELRPALLDDMGLSAVLRHHVDNFSKLTGVKTSLKLSHEYNRLPRNLETILFRITQEALTNVARHAQARHAWIELNCRNCTVSLKISDDGLGFDMAEVLDRGIRNGWGLIGIQERVKSVNGRIEIESEIEKGTRLVVKIPITKEQCV
jgi:signal transduction histidine kinase